jgi:nucleotide-binding universal stress UspA family protein
MNWSLPRKNVVVPWDFSEAAAEAVAAALTMVADPKDLTVLHAVEPVGQFATFGEEKNLDARRHLAETLDKMRAALDKLGYDTIAAAVRDGVAPQAIAEYVAEHDVDLVVMPSNRRSGVKRLFLGSVTEQVLRRVECPVLVLRATVDEDDD